jgi:dTDP-glucose 4,6-dehydratase
MHILPVHSCILAFVHSCIEMGTLLITGGAGFIGSNFVHHALASTSDRIVVVDKLTYAGSLLNLEQALKDPRLTFVQADIADADAMARAFADARPGAVVNLAAETHVDRSIDRPGAFIETNIVGTFTLLETARKHLATLRPDDRQRFRFLHVSSDEVYGALGATGVFSEETPYAPNSPYAASKASADHLARAYFHTYGLPVLMTNCSNNYGPFQYPEKLIPLMILNALDGKPLPIYGDGGNVRDWLHVDDHCRAIDVLIERGASGEVYNIGGGNEVMNVELTRRILDALDKPLSLIKPVQDRPGHDRRYCLDTTKLRALGWAPQMDFDDGLRRTVDWYRSNEWWWRPIKQNDPAYRSYYETQYGRRV